MKLPALALFLDVALVCAVAAQAPGSAPTVPPTAAPEPAPAAPPPAAAPAPAPTAAPESPRPVSAEPVLAPAPESASPTGSSAATAATPATSSPAAGPTGPSIEVDLAPPSEEPAPADEGPAVDPTLYGLRAQRLNVPGTTLGGYGELHYALQSVTGPGESSAEADLHRLVLFVSHNFDRRLRFYTEIEVEHAVASADDEGEVEIEQAFVDYLLLDEALGLRAGLVLVPMGIINQVHEPPVFHGVERPDVDRVIIPTTWREAGIGLFGEPVEGFRYELYLVSGLDPSGFSAERGLAGGRSEAAEARTDGLAVTGRVEVEPTLGVVAGLAAYLGEAGPNADFYDVAGAKAELDVPVYGVSLDVRGRHAGLEARALLAWFAIGDTAELRRVTDVDGNPLGLDVGSELYGLYGELAYDVLRPFVATEQQLLPFVRVERYDTLADVEGRSLIRADEVYGVTQLVAGLTYRPITQVAFKADYTWQSPDGPTPALGRLDLGVGVMF